MDIVAKMLSLDAALIDAGIPHAFGGALALAWCTKRARGTIDIDLNVFVAGHEATRVFAALPGGVAVGPAEEAAVADHGQVRLDWDGVPLDLFFNTTPFHEGVGRRIRFESFAGRELPFLACSDLAVFKAFFDRPRDWVDLVEMLEMGSVDVEVVLGTLVLMLGGDDVRVARFTELAMESGARR